MDSYEIRGGTRLSGELRASGAKNAVLPILAASAMIPDETVLDHCPDLADVDNMCRILTHLGCRIRREGETLRVDASRLHCCSVPEELMKSLRSSVFLAGPLLSRCGQAILSTPGGCAIGKRPIDLHFLGLTALGASVTEREGRLFCRSGRLRGTEIRLDYPSVGATENILMAAASAVGETVLTNAAREPEIVDLQNFLNGCGAQISGAGTSVIRIRGTGQPLRSCRYRIMGDRIEGGTYLMAAAVTGGTVTVRDLDPVWLGAELAALERMGCRVERSLPGECEPFVAIRGPQALRSPGFVRAEPWPGFSTDLQSPLMALCTVAEGTTVIEDTVFENRFQCAGELRKLGAVIRVNGRRAEVTGTASLAGTTVTAGDLRGGAALVLAGLAARGKTIVENICHTDRGYGKFDIVLKELGANIERRDVNERERRGETTGVSKE